MKSLSILLLVAFLSLGGCTNRQASDERLALNKPNAPQTTGDSNGFLNDGVRTLAEEVKSQTRPISLEAAIDRKIIRDADLTIEVNSTTEAQQRVTSIAETLGGFVVTSEAKQRDNADPAKRIVDVKLVVRVPSPQFNLALEQIERLATNLPQRNVTGKDVTEEFIDLEARIKTQKALELQFLEIMKQANKVGDALEVQRQIADVRTEIEKLEGRKRFLENRSSLSTITVNIQTPMPIVVSTAGFGHTLREAVSDSVDLASGMVLFFVRFMIIMLPVFAFVILPLGLIGRYFRRRAQRIRLASQLEGAPATN